VAVVPAALKDLDAEAQEYRKHSHPLPPVHCMLVNDDTNEKCYYFPGYCDGDTGQTPEFVNDTVYEDLAEGVGETEGKNVRDDGRVGSQKMDCVGQL